MSDYGGWPTLEELRRVLNVDPDSTVHDTTLERVLEGAIERVKSDIGSWDDLLDEPPPAHLAQAALRMAELLALTPEAAAAASADPTYRTLLKGHIRRFAIS